MTCFLREDVDLECPPKRMFNLTVKRGWDAVMARGRFQGLVDLGFLYTTGSVGDDGNGRDGRGWRTETATDVVVTVDFEVLRRMHGRSSRDCC